MMMAAKFATRMEAANMNPEMLCLDEKEAEKLSKAIANVQAQYPDVAFDPKHAAIMALVFTLIEIEGPRAMLIWRAMQATKGMKEE